MLYSIREEEWYDNIYDTQGVTSCDYIQFPNKTVQIITEKYNIIKGYLLKCFLFI